MSPYVPIVSIYYQNVRSIRNKVNGFFNGTSDMGFDIICISETWLNDSISNSEIISPHLYRASNIICNRVIS